VVVLQDRREEKSESLITKTNPIVALTFEWESYIKSNLAVNAY